MTAANTPQTPKSATRATNGPDVAPSASGAEIGAQGESVISDDVASLAALFDNVRHRHRVEVMQSHLLACTCGASLPIEVGEDGRPLYNPAIRHHHEKLAEAVAGLRAGDFAVVESLIAARVDAALAEVEQRIEAEKWQFRRVTGATAGDVICRTYEDATRIVRAYRQEDHR